MTTTVAAPERPTSPSPKASWGTRVLRGLGIALITAGVVVFLFVVYLLYWTDRQTAVEQATLLDEFDQAILAEPPTDDDRVRDVANIPVEAEPLPEPDPASSDEPSIAVPTEPGEAYALLWFERDGQFVVADEILAAVEGVTLDHLARGPGHYPESVAPGAAGTFAIAGHRTTYGRPFHNLDVLQPGDEIHVVDLEGRHWVYDFLELRPVAPTDVWVVSDDPLNRGITHGITLTTCHPKYSAAQRLVAFGELQVAPAAGAASTGQATDTAGEAATQGSG